MKTGQFFTLDEFTVSQTASRRGWLNDPPEEAIKAIKALCANVLDPLRKKLGKPIVINSGYRSYDVNRAVGGAPTSQHRKGEAADILCPGVPVVEVIRTIRELGLPFDQLIDEFSGSWTHVSYGPRDRREVLRARYKGGRVVYERVE